MINQQQLNRDPLKDVSFWNNAIVHWIIIANIVLNLGVIAFLLFYVHPSEVPIKLQYNVFFGTSLHVEWWKTYSLPLVGMVFFVIDLLIGNVLYYTRERIAAYIILLGALFAHIALAIAALSIVLNNF
ncbi:MAG: hypothetical protein KAT32_04880 [Candidatus Moranbacteria bacterium]|nr:hypothetical protein [Candidatus Moranbacteria bacterium]